MVEPSTAVMLNLWQESNQSGQAHLPADGQVRGEGQHVADHLALLWRERLDDSSPALAVQCPRRLPAPTSTLYPRTAARRSNIDAYPIFGHSFVPARCVDSRNTTGPEQGAVGEIAPWTL